MSTLTDTCKFCHWEITNSTLDCPNCKRSLRVSMDLPPRPVLKARSTIRPRAAIGEAKALEGQLTSQWSSPDGSPMAPSSKRNRKHSRSKSRLKKETTQEGRFQNQPTQASPKMKLKVTYNGVGAVGSAQDHTVELFVYVRQDNRAVVVARELCGHNLFAAGESAAEAIDQQCLELLSRYGIKRFVDYIFIECTIEETDRLSRFRIVVFDRQSYPSSKPLYRGNAMTLFVPTRRLRIGTSDKASNVSRRIEKTRSQVEALVTSSAVM